MYLLLFSSVYLLAQYVFGSVYQILVNDHYLDYFYVVSHCAASGFDRQLWKVLVTKPKESPYTLGACRKMVEK